MFKNFLTVVLLILPITGFASTSLTEKMEEKIENIKTKMMSEKTLSIIKPDAVSRNLIGKINTKFESAGLKIVGMKMIHMSKQQAEQFYAVHAARPFYNDLVSFMISGPVVVQVLEGVDAVAKNREIMGATNPAEAAEGTIRRECATSIEANCVHGSDSKDNAKTEVAFFFNDNEIFSR